MNDTKRSLPIILSITSSIGVLATSYFVARNTLKASEKIKNLKKYKTNKKEYVIQGVKTLAPVYLPSILTGVATVSSIVASTIISKKAEASLIATTAMLSQGWNKYKYKVKDALGINGEKKITDVISKDIYMENCLDEKVPFKQLYYEEHLGFFECDPVDFMSAVNDMNQRLHSPDPNPDGGTFYWTTLEKFVKDAKADVYDKDKLNASKNMGWTSDYLAEAYGLQNIWVHPTYTNVIEPEEDNKLKYIKVDFWEDPIELSSGMMPSEQMYRRNFDDFDNGLEVDEYYFDDRLEYKNNDEKTISEKPDCDRVNDDLAHFIPSNPKDPVNNKNVYADSTNKGEN